MFSFFNKGSGTRKLILNFESLDLSTPSFCIGELKKHKERICRKSGLSKKEFEEALNGIKIFVRVIAIDEYKDFIKEATRISPDPDDTEFFALALKLDCPIWSEDRLLKQQPRVKILSTGELMKLLDIGTKP